MKEFKRKEIKNLFQMKSKIMQKSVKSTFRQKMSQPTITKKQEHCLRLKIKIKTKKPFPIKISFSTACLHFTICFAKTIFVLYYLQNNVFLYSVFFCFA